MRNLSSCRVYNILNLAICSFPSITLSQSVFHCSFTCMYSKSSQKLFQSLKSLFFSCWVTLYVVISRHNFAFLSLPQLLTWHLQRTISVESAWTQPSTVSCWSAATWWPVPPVVNRWTSAPSVDSMLYDVCIYSGRNDIALNYGSFFSYGISLDGSRNWPFSLFF